jgi:hypothetical protein
MENDGAKATTRREEATLVPPFLAKTSLTVAYWPTGLLTAYSYRYYLGPRHETVERKRYGRPPTAKGPLALSLWHCGYADRRSKIAGRIVLSSACLSKVKKTWPRPRLLVLASCRINSWLLQTPFQNRRTRRCHAHRQTLVSLPQPQYNQWRAATSGALWLALAKDFSLFVEKLVEHNVVNA